MLSVRIMRAALAPIMSVALLLLSVSPAPAQAALEVGEGTLAMLYRTIGDSSAMRAAIASAFGRASPLLGLSSEQLGRTVVDNQNLALDVLSSGHLSDYQQKMFAAAINAGRISNPVLQGKTIAEEPLLALQRPALPAAVNPNVSAPATRTWTVKTPSALTGWGDVSLDPPITIPVMTFKRNQLQMTADIIPIGKPAAATATAGCVTFSCLSPAQINAFHQHLANIFPSAPPATK